MYSVAPSLFPYKFERHRLRGVAIANAATVPVWTFGYQGECSYGQEDKLAKNRPSLTD